MHDAKTENPLETIYGNIARAAKIAGRKASDIELITVSKTRTADEIAPLLATGHKSFGENRVQEAAEKWPALKTQYPDTKLHMIGQLQSNKAEEATMLFDYIHSLDRISLIKALGKAFKKTGRQIPCFLQVNIGGEEQKGGCDIDDIPALLEVSKASDVEIVGLMCLPPANVEPAPYFALLGELAQRHAVKALSMGMSADYETAIMLGATHVRIGTALFGQRGEIPNS